MKRISQKHFLMFGIACLSFLLANHAMAQEEVPLSIQVSPLRYDWVLRSGDEKIGTINLKNNANSPYKVDIQMEDFQVSSDSSEAQFFVPDDNHPLKAYDVINWISTPDMNMVLSAGESRNIVFKINVPKETPTGGYYGAMFFQYEPESLNDNNGSEAVELKVNTRLGVLLTMSVQGASPIMEKGDLQLFKSDKSLFWKNPVTLKAEVKNTGNVPFKTSGTIEIYRADNKVYSSDILSSLNYPGRFRTHDFSWNPGLLDFGIFKAKLHMISEDEIVTIDGDTTFWIIPWKLLAIVFATIAVIFAIFNIGRMSGKKKEKVGVKE